MHPNLTPRTNEVFGDTTSVWTFNGQRVKPYVGPLITYDSTALRAVDRKKMRGFDTERFRTRMRKGELLPYTPWYQFETSGSITESVYDVLYGAPGAPEEQHEWVVGHICADDTWVLSEEVVASYAPLIYDQYVADAAASINDRSWDALTFLAEFSQLTGLLTAIRNNIVKLFTKSKKKRTTWQREVNKLASSYLVFRYGYGPLMSDIKALNALLSRMTQGEVRRHSARKEGSYSFSVPYVREIPSSVVTSYRELIVDRVTISCRGSVAADIAIPKVRFNALTTGWEKLPFSFVVDWFANVGTTISALSVILNSVQYTACKGYKITVERKMTQESIPGPWFRSGTLRFAGESKASMTRREPCGIPIIPRLRAKFSWQKVLDLTALILQRLR